MPNRCSTPLPGHPFSCSGDLHELPGRSISAIVRLVPWKLPIPLMRFYSGELQQLIQSQGEKVRGVRKIAVLRANALGDFIFALPALEALRAAYPQAEIVLLAKGWHATFLKGRPGPVDRVVVVPPCEGVSEEPGAPGSVENSAELE